jgi:outer membrane lipoprotein-sorting protein
MGMVSTKALVSNLLVVLFLALGPGGAAAVDDATSALLGEIRQATASVKAFRSQFVQERRLSLFAEPVIFHGSLTVVRPDQLRWEFTRPVPSALIFNGRSGLRCNDQAEPSRFDLDTDPIMRTVAEQLWLWLGGDYSKLGDGYQLQSEGVSLVIRPKDEKTREYVEKITITFNRQTLQPERVVIDEPGGDATLLRFTATDQNGDVDPVLFTHCSPP